ncbi:MAG: UDP-N-acetylmuramate--L-alanine ligase [Bacteroidota bacterium]|nr:UDP-N-acetylmuramate--L-alanine ligase [Bacteroidota bacterium]
MKLNKYQDIYLIGIGGIGMSALARYFISKDKMVSGYDAVRSDLCIELEKEGVKIHYDASVNKIPEKLKKKSYAEGLIIYTPAVDKSNIELSYFIKNNIPLFKRSEVLGMISKEYYTIAIAGTHGKTTTTCLLTHILKYSGKACTAFLGGISKNYNTNFILGKDDEVLIVEADEYDRSFLNLHADIAVITSIESDHLDIYKDCEELSDAFIEFVSNMKSTSTLILEDNVAKNFDVERKGQIVFSYSSNQDCVANYCIEDIKTEGYNTRFKVKYFNTLLGNFKSSLLDKDAVYNVCDHEMVLNMPGEHNISNALAAIAVCDCLNISFKNIADAITSFHGIKRRYEIQIDRENLVFIDDYAHHPEEIKATINTTKILFPGRKITVLFQPHLFSRTKFFLNEFAIALSLASEIILLDIYPAREQPIPGITSDLLLEKCNLKYKEISDKSQLLKLIRNKDLDILLTLGAGDISTLIQPIKHMLN